MNTRNTRTWKAVSVLVVLTMLTLTTLFAPVPVALAANTGYRNPTANEVYTTGFTNPDRAYGNDSSYASRDNNANGVAHVYRDYGFSIPADAVIQGIQVRLDWWMDSTSGTNSIRVYLSWDGGSSWTAYQSATTERISDNNPTDIAGDIDDTWGRAWSPSDFSNANFRVRLELRTTDNSRDFRIDWVPVQVTYNRYPGQPQLVSPTDDAIISDSTPTLDWNSTTDPDGDTLTYYVRYTTTGSTWSSWFNTGGSTQYTTATLADGLHSWQARACDPSPFCTDSVTWSFTVDTIAPTSSATAPAIANAAPLTVSATNAADSGSGVANVRLYSRISTGSWQLASQINTPPYSWNFTPGQGDGTYYFQSVACDNANNCEPIPSGTSGTGDDSTIYDATPPISSITTVPAGPINAPPIALPWTASDATSGIATNGVTLWYKFGTGGTWTADGTASGTNGTFNFTPSNGDGTYCFQTIATDNAGNVEAGPTGNGDGCTLYRTLATIGDFIWNDANGNGTFDGGESGLNWQVNLAGPQPASTTAVNGNYSFAGLPAGTYTVTVSVPAGWARTNPVEHPLVVTVVVGQDYATADFGFSQNHASISGYVWYDANRNGVLDAGETGLGAVGVTLRRGVGVIGTTNSNAHGFYFFGGLNVAGDYQVDVDQNDPDLGIRVSTTPDPLNVPGVTLGNNYPNRNFGFAEPVSVVKPLYLHAGDVLNRNRPGSNNTTTQIDDATSHTWTQSPVMAGPLQFTTNAITVALHLDPTSGSDVLGNEYPPDVRVTLRYGAVVIGTPQVLNDLTGGIQLYTFSFTHPTSLAAGSAFSVQVDVYGASGGWLPTPGNVVVYYDAYPSYNSRIDLPVYSYLRVDAANSGTYDAGYPGGAASDTFLAGDTVYFRARATDPFGNYDVTGATLTIPGLVTNQAMTRYSPNPDAATAVYQYSRSGFTLGSYTYIMTATEGLEGEVTGVYTGTFRVIVSDLTDSSKEARSWPAGQLITQTVPGAVIQYTLHISNTGDALAPSVSITDAIPAHATYEVGSVNGGVYNLTLNAITWSGSVAAHSERTITFRVRFDPVLDNGLAVDNVVLINDGTNTFSRNNRVTVVSSPDLSTSRKTVNTTSAEPGDTLTYRITLTNTGNMNASASLNDVVPLNTTLVGGSLSATSGNATYNPGNLTISWNGTVAGQNVNPGIVVVTYQALVAFPLNNGTRITNTAFIDDGFAPNGTTPLPSQVVTTITSEPLIQAYSSKIVDEPTAAPGGVLHYHIYLINGGKMNAPTVNLTDTIPAHTTYVVGSLRANIGTVTYDGTNNRIVWSGPVNPGAPIDIHFNARADNVLDNGLVIANTATVNDNYHPGPFDLTASTTINSAPNLRTTSYKTVSAATAAPGQALTYDIHLANTGNMVAHTFVTDTLSADLVNVTVVSPPGATYNAGLHAILWTGDVTPGVETVIRFTANVRSPMDATQTIIYNTALVNDGVEAPFSIYPPTQTTVNASPDLSASRKAVNTATASPGDVITYTIRLTNTGTMNTWASVQDVMPNQTTYLQGSLSFSVGSGSYDPFNRWIQWDGPANPGAPVVITYAVTIDAVMDQPDTTIYNDARINDGVHVAFLTPGVTTTVHAEPNLTTSTKVVDLSDAAPGQQLWYRITVRNTGRMIAHGASVSDTLPAQVTYVSGQFPTGGGYNAVSRYVYWNGDVTPGTDVIVDYYVAVNDPLDNGTLIANTAEIRDGYTGHAALTTSPAAQTTVHSAPNLGTSSKTVDKGTAAPGDVLTYTLTLLNTGNMNAHGARITDTIPANTVYVNGSVSATSGTPSYDLANNRILWNGDVVKGVPVTLRFRVQTNNPLPNGTAIDNTAVIYDGFQPTTLSRSANTLIGSAPNLSASTKTVNRPTAEPGDVLTYTLVLRNSGNANTNVTLSDALPAHVAYVPGSVTGGASHNGATLSWSGPLNAGAAITFTYRVTINLPLDNNTLIENSATINDGVHAAFDTTPPAQTLIQSTPNLLTSNKAVSLLDAAPGNTLYYTITLRNTGRMVAASATMYDVVPGQIEIVGGSLAASSGSVNYTSYNRRISWSGSVSPLTPVVVTFRAVIQTPLNDGTQIINSATMADGIHSAFDTDPVVTTVHSAPLLTTSTKAVDRATAAPGDQLRYTITLINTGNMIAQASVADQLPANVTYFSGPTANSGSASWDGFNNRITWNGQVAPGMAVIIQYYVTVNSPTDNGTVISNTATINDGYHAAFDTGAAQTTINSAPNLNNASTTKTVSAPTAAPGDEIEYTINVVNSGNMVAYNASVTDLLPANTTWSDGLAWSGGGNATWNGTQVRWDGNVTPGTPVVIRFRARINTPLPNNTSIVNTATINDGFSGHASFTRQATTTVQSAPNLSTSSKTVNAASARPGEVLIYTLSLINTGNMSATGATLNDALPANVTWGGFVTPNGATFAANTVSWSGNVGPGTPVVIVYRVTINSPLNSGTLIANTATVNDGFPGHSAFDTTPAAQTTINSAPDLSTSTKTVNAGLARPGDVITYTVTLINTGDMNASAYVVDGIPAHANYVVGSAQASSGSVTYNLYQNRIEWNGTVPVGTPVTLRYAVQIEFPLDNGTRVWNTATVGDNVHTPFDTAAANTTITSAPNLTLHTSKTVNLADIAPGNLMRYTINVVNDGDMTASNTQIQDVLPAGVTFANGPFASSGSATWDSFNNRVLWSGAVLPGTPATIQYDVRVNDPLDNGTVITNTATVNDNFAGHAAFETTPAASTTVHSAPNLGTSSKTVDRGTAAPGDVLLYTLTLLNTGNMNAHGARITDTIPLSTTYVAGSVTGGATYDAGNNRILWNGDVNKGTPVVVTFRVRTNNPLPNGTLISNTAQIYDGFQPTLLTRTADTIIGSAPNLSASTKTVNRPTAEPGDVLTYTLVLRNSGNANTNVTLSDALPAHVAYVPGSVTGGASHNGATLSWSGPLNAGAAITFTYRVTINLPLDNNTLIENSATINDGVHAAFDTTPPAQTLIQSTPNLLTSNKAVSLLDAAPGNTLYYTITLRNTGRMVAQNATMYDVLPSQIEIVGGSLAASSGSASYNAINRRISWSGSVSPLTPVVVTFRATIHTPLDDLTQVINSATIGDGIHSTLDTDPVVTTVHSAPLLTTSTKTVDRATAAPGDQLRYTITLINTGNMIAQANVVDTLPANVAYASGPTANSGSASWDGFNNRVLWNGQVAPGMAVVIQYYVTVNNPTDNGTVIANTATINDGYHAAFDTAPAAQTTITSSPNLSTSSKTVDRATAVPGDELLYTINLVNTGSMNAPGALVTDTIPLHTGYVATSLNATSGTATWDAANNRILWNGAVNRSTPVVITFRVQVNTPLANNTSIVNTATINDGFAGHAVIQRQATTTINSAPNLSTSTKTVSAGTARPGDPLDYTITLINTGNMTATGVTLNDVLPANTTWSGWVSQHGATFAANTVSWTGNVGPGAPVVIVYRVTINSPLNNGTIIANSASINDGFPGHATFDTTPAAQTAVQSAPNLTTSTKTVNTATAIPGQVITYTITLVNSGDMNATAYVMDTLPANTTYVANSVQASNGSVVYNLIQNRVEWNGTFTTSTPVSIRYAVQIATPLDNGTLIWNTATIGDGVHAPFDTTAANTTITSAPNLVPRTTKTANLSSAVPGGLVRYTINLVNDGNMVAGNATVADTLPAGVTFTSGPFASGGSATWDSFNNRVTWSGAVVPGTPVVVQYDVRVNDPLDNGTLITNTATVNDGFPGHTAFETTPPAQTTVTSAPNLSTSTKAVDRSNATPGDQLLYTISLANSGDMNAHSARITDTIPANTAYVAGSVSPNATYDATNNRILWNGDVNKGTPVVITFRVQTNNPLPNGTSITNTVSIYDGFHPTVLTRMAQTVIGSAPNLSTSTKTVNATNVVPGGVLTYTLTLHNSGNAAAAGALLTDTLPANTAFDSWVTQNGAALNGNVITWNGNVAPGVDQAIVFRVRANTPLDNGTIIANSATVNDSFAGHTPFTIGPAQTTITSAPNLNTSAKAVNTLSAAPGQQLYYTVTLTNTGNMVAHNAEVMDLIPANTAYVANSASATSGSVTYESLYNRIRWTGEVTPNTNIVISFRAQINSPLNSGTHIINWATVDDRFHTPAHDTNTVDTVVTSAPNMSGSSKTVDRASASPDDQLRYTITLSNTGTMAATAHVDDVLPTDVTFVSGPVVTGGGAGGWDNGGRRIYWDGQVSPGQTVTIVYYVRVNNPLNNGMIIANTANINDGVHPAFDTTPAAQTAITSAPNLTTSTKVVDRGTAAPGSRVVYTITLNNTGSMNATNVTVVDTLPPQYVTLVATPPGATYNAGARTLTWANLTVNRNQPVVLTFQVDLDAVVPDGTSIVNTASINDGFPGHANVPVQATTTVGSAPNLSTSTKQVSRTSAAPNNPLVYTITLRNTGNASAVGALITDTLPANVHWDGWVAQPAGAEMAANSVTWSGNVVPGMDVVIAFRVLVNTPLDNGTVIANSATVNDNYSGHTPFTLGPAQTTITSAPNLVTSFKEVTATVAVPGQELLYRVTMINTGNMVAHGAEVLDSMPAHSTYVINSLTLTGGGFAEYQSLYGRIHWIGDVTPGSNIVITFRVRLDFPLNSGTQIANGATVDDKFHPSFNTNTVTTDVTSTPDLSTSSKTVNLHDANPGDQLQYAITLLNSGTMAATAHVDDALPAEVTYESGPVVNGGGTGGYGGGHITWDGQVSPNQTVTIIYYVRVNNPLNNLTIINNSATINDGVHGAFETAPAAQTTVHSAPNLNTSTKTVDRGTASPRDRLRYTITLNNTGNMNATNVTVVDTLPPAYATLVATPPGATYNAANRTLTWNALTVNRNQPVVLTFDVDLDAVVPDGAAIVNHVEINDGFNPGVIAREATTMVGSAPNLSTSTKQVSQASAAPGDMLVYTLILRNNGNANATGAMITDTLPANTHWDGWVAQPAGAGMAANTVTWTGNVVPGTDVIIAFRVHVNTPLDNGTVIANSVTINDRFSNHVPFTIGPVQTTIHSTPNLGTSVKAVSLTDARPGNELAYVVTLVNTGDMVAHNAIVLDEIPVHTRYVDASVGATSGTAVYQPAYDRIRWTGEVAPGTNVVITFRVRVDLPLNDGTTIDNLATVEDGVHNPSDTNTVTTHVHSEPILSTSSKTVNLADATPGQVLHYVITLNNTGDMAAATTVVDTLPPQVSHASGPTVLNGPPANWDSIARRVSWNGQVLPGTPVVIDYYVTVNSPLDDRTVITNTATINDGIHPSFETAPATQTTVHSTVNLGTSTKEVDRQTAAPGETVEYIITLRNTGSMNAATARVTDTLPTEVGFVSGPIVLGGGTASYISAERQIRWNGPVNVGQAVVIRYTVRLNADLTGGTLVENTATVDDGRGTVTEVGPAQIYIGRALGLRLTDGRDTVRPGDLITYVVAYSGTEPLNFGSVQIEIPAHTILVSSDCTQQGNLVSCQLIALPPSFYGEHYLVVQVDPVLDNGTEINTTALIGGDGKSNRATERATVVSAPSWITSIKTADRYSVEPTARFTYTIRLANSGNMHAHAAVMTDALPSQVTFAGFVTSNNGTATYNQATNQIVWNGVVQVGSTTVITYAVTVNSGVPAGTVIQNLAHVRDEVNSAAALLSCDVNVVAQEPRHYTVFLPVVANKHGGPQLPDLVVTGISVTPANPSAGQTVDLAVTIKNQGNAATPACFWIDLYINPTQLPITVNRGWFETGSEGGLVWSVCGLDAGQSVTLHYGDTNYRTAYSQFDGRFTSPLTYTLYAQVDSWNPSTDYGAVYESSEQNNVYGPYSVSVGGVGGAERATGAPGAPEAPVPPTRPDIPPAD